MTELIDADDLAMLASGFEAALVAAPGPAEADAALFELGWADLLAASPTQASAMALRTIGSTGAGACLLDDVVAAALGVEVTPDTCVVLPAPHAQTPSGSHAPGEVTIDGVVSARVDTASVVLVPISNVALARVDASTLRREVSVGIDADGPFRRLRTQALAGEIIHLTGSWPDAVTQARVALAHQLIGSARWMLAEARQHAVDRTQFGRSIASFQALRHKLAETLVAIEGAESVATSFNGDQLHAALAKSLAGAATLTAGKHAQQVLAGIGFTVDHPFQARLKQALVLDTLFGSAKSLPAEIGNELIQRGEAPRLIGL